MVWRYSAEPPKIPCTPGSGTTLTVKAPTVRTQVTLAMMTGTMCGMVSRLAGRSSQLSFNDSGLLTGESHDCA